MRCGQLENIKICFRIEGKTQSRVHQKCKECNPARITYKLEDPENELFWQVISCGCHFYTMLHI